MFGKISIKKIAFLPASRFNYGIFGSSFVGLLLFVGVVFLQSSVFSNTAFGQDGLLDSSFNNTGKVVTQFGFANSRANDSVLQSDGKIVVAGAAGGDMNFPSNVTFSVARYNTNGSLDMTFGGGDGIATTVPNGATPSVALGVALQSDGKIVAVGYSGVVDSQGTQPDAVVARYNADGMPDTSFNGNGYRVFNLDPQFSNRDIASDVVIQSDGKIVFVHQGFISGANNFQGYTIIRLNSDGSYDTTFGNGGKAQIASSPISLNSVGYTYKGAQLALRSNGKIVISLTNFEKPVAQLNSDGTLDSSFGTGGFILESNAYSDSIALQADGKIITVNSSEQIPIAVRRYNADGSKDTAFGDSGKKSVMFPEQNQDITRFFDVTVQSDGKILIGGDLRLLGRPDRDFALARLNSNGSFDTQFGQNGSVTTNIQGNDYARSVIIQPDGKIILIGESGGGFTLVRYIPGSLTINCSGVRSDFDGDGKSDLAYFNSSGQWRYTSSFNSDVRGVTWGSASDILVPADYNGDCRTDYAVFRDGIWYVQNTTGTFLYYYFGQAGDIPVPADYDGDGFTDVAVFRSGVWYVQGTRDGFFAMQFGIASDKPVPADYDGDGKADIAVYRDGYWYIMQSGSGLRYYNFGLSTDKPVVGDYDGDGKTDFAVFRPSNGTWYISASAQGIYGINWGVSTDKLVPADYDGDGKTDVAVYRNGDWYILQTTSGFRAQNFGVAGNTPIQSVYLP